MTERDWPDTHQEVSPPQLNSTWYIPGARSSTTVKLAPDPKSAAAYNDAAKKGGQSVILRGVMVPGKDLEALVPLQVGQVR